MSYSVEQTMRILRTKHRVTTYHHMIAKTLKEDLSHVPDDAILLGFDDDEECDCDIKMTFQKESEFSKEEYENVI